MQRYHSNRNRKNSKKLKKEKFWSGSGKFFLLVIILYALIFGINEIVSIGKEQAENFSADNIEVNGNEILTREKVIELSGITESTNQIENIEIDKIADALMKSTYIKGVSITKRLPRTLNITIDERKPVAFIYGRGLNLIDSDGFLIPVPRVKKVWDLPLISGISERLGQLGKKTESNQALQSIMLVNYLQKQNTLIYGLISEINLSDRRSIEIIMIKGGARIRINRENYDKELYILQNYIATYMNWADLKVIEYIDLRFKDQLIVKKKA